MQHNTTATLWSWAPAWEAGQIRVGEPERQVDARLINDAEREELRAQVAEQAPHFARFQARTGRTLPIAILSERSSLE